MRFKLDPLAPNGVSQDPGSTRIVQSTSHAMPGKDGRVQTVVGGDNVTVDSSDPANPVVSASIPESAYIDRFEDLEDYMYFGLASSGSAEGSAVWQIRRFNRSADAVELADGDDDFDNVWTSRASLSYS